jgi:hypothetical protein
MTLSYTSWAPLREAVPSFEERWAEISSMSWYDPTLEGLNRVDAQAWRGALLDDG